MSRKNRDELRRQTADEIRNEITKTLTEYRTNLFLSSNRKEEVKIVDYFLDVVNEILNLYLTRKQEKN